VLRLQARLVATTIAAVLIVGVCAAAVSRPAPAPLAVTTDGRPTTRGFDIDGLIPRMVPSTAATTVPPVPATTPAFTTSSMAAAPRQAHTSTYPANGAVDASGKSLCPCDPRTGEPLGGAVQDKGFEVRVTDGAERPLAGLCVQTVHPSWFESDVPVLLTDADGRASINLGTSHRDPLLQLLVSDCRASAPRWEPKVEALTPGGYSHIVSVLTPTASISGTIVDQHGRPPNGGCAWVSPSKEDGWRSSRIDSLGRYQVGGLSAGYHQVMVNLDCVSPGTIRAGVYQGALDPLDSTSGLTEITLSSGESAVLSFAVFRPPNI
jgi:hypothetical protein